MISDERRRGNGLKPQIIVFTNADHADTPYDQWLSDCDVSLWVFVDVAKSHGYRHLAQLKSYEAFFTNSCAELDAAGIASARPTIALIARAEMDVMRAARLRERLGVPGQWTVSATAYRDKIVMKDYVSARGLPTPAFQKLGDIFDLTAFVERHDYPVIVKPVDASGSVDVQVIEGRSDLMRFAAKGWTRDMEVESYVQGEMYHVDGLVVNDEVVFAAASKYVGDCLAWRRNDFIGSVVLRMDHPLRDRLLDFAKRTIKALPPLNTAPFHCEIFHSSDDQLIFCEIASRTGGGRIAQAIELACGINLDREWTRATCGKPLPNGGLDSAMTTAGFILIPPRCGVLEKIPDLSLMPGVEAQVFTGRAGERFTGGQKSGHYLASYTVVGQSESDVKARILAIAERFGGESVWTEDVRS